MKKILAFSLWGTNPKYTVGAIRNAELAREHYPDWICRFYIGRSSPTETIKQLMDMPNVEVVIMGELGDWRGMFWRFLPASEDDVDVFVSRDCDSRISAREAAAVNEWLQSPYLVHSMADHQYHFHPRMGLMGGMFGMKRHACNEMQSLIEAFKNKYPDAWQCDQNFLRDYVFPLVSSRIYATSDIHAGCHRFPLPRVGGSFVGEIIGPNEEILHPEHRTLRGN